jgi:hypothetical protein
LEYDPQGRLEDTGWQHDVLRFHRDEVGLEHAYMQYLTSFIEDDREIILGILEQSKNDANFGNSVIGTTYLIASNKCCHPP